MKNKNINIRIPEEYLKALRKEREKTGAPISEIMRRAIKKYLKIKI